MKKIIKNTIFTILLSVLIILGLFFAYLYFYASNDRNLSGKWTARLDMTEQAAVTALGWLQDMEAVSVSMQDMEYYMHDLTIELDLTLEQTARTEGTFASALVPESYAACSQAAYESFAAAFRDLVTERLRMAGYTGDLSEKAVESLIAETFGMPTVSYLSTCVPDLLPPLEELQTRCDGSGTYTAAEGILTRQFDSGSLIRTRTERYIRKDTTLVLTESAASDAAGYFMDHYPVLYTLQRSQEPQ